jgi:hypothetical protein
MSGKGPAGPLRAQGSERRAQGSGEKKVSGKRYAEMAKFRLPAFGIRHSAFGIRLGKSQQDDSMVVVMTTHTSARKRKSIS